MEQYKKIVLEAPVKFQGSAIFSHEEVAENATDKAIHFTHITADDREKLKKWLANQNGSTEKERIFLRFVKRAVQVLNYDYWIANLEPSVAKGKIYYAKGEKVGVCFSCNQYKQMAEAYAPERGSRMASSMSCSSGTLCVLQMDCGHWIMLQMTLRVQATTGMDPTLLNAWRKPVKENVVVTETVRVIP